ncbi:2105_t:CDS:1, partial [Acaulospora morrowiae]
MLETSLYSTLYDPVNGFSGDVKSTSENFPIPYYTLSGVSFPAPHVPVNDFSNNATLGDYSCKSISENLSTLSNITVPTLYDPVNDFSDNVILDNSSKSISQNFPLPYSTLSGTSFSTPHVPVNGFSNNVTLDDDSSKSTSEIFPGG